MVASAHEKCNLEEKLKVQSCKLYSNKYTIASNQITKTEIFAFLVIVDFKLLSRKVLFINRKEKGRLLFKKIADFTGLLQNYRYLECEIFRILLKHLSDSLSVLFQLA